MKNVLILSIVFLMIFPLFAKVGGKIPVTLHHLLKEKLQEDEEKEIREMLEEFIRTNQNHQEILSQVTSYYSLYGEEKWDAEGFKDRIRKYMGFSKYFINSQTETWLLFNVSPEKPCEITLIDGYNKSCFSADHSLEAAYFQVYDSTRSKVYPDVYLEKFQDGGYTPLSDEPCGELTPSENSFLVRISGAQKNYEGSFAIRVKQNGVVIKPVYQPGKWDANLRAVGHGYRLYQWGKPVKTIEQKKGLFLIGSELDNSHPGWKKIKKGIEKKNVLVISSDPEVKWMENFQTQGKDLFSAMMFAYITSSRGINNTKFMEWMEKADTIILCGETPPLWLEEGEGFAGKLKGLYNTYTNIFVLESWVEQAEKRGMFDLLFQSYQTSIRLKTNIQKNPEHVPELIEILANEYLGKQNLKPGDIVGLGTGSEILIWLDRSFNMEIIGTGKKESFVYLYNPGNFPFRTQEGLLSWDSGKDILVEKIQTQKDQSIFYNLEKMRIEKGNISHEYYLSVREGKIIDEDPPYRK